MPRTVKLRTRYVRTEDGDFVVEQRRGATRWSLGHLCGRRGAWYGCPVGATASTPVSRTQAEAVADMVARRTWLDVAKGA